MIIVWQGVVKKILNKKDQESPNFRLPYYNTAWKSSVLEKKYWCTFSKNWLTADAIYAMGKWPDFFIKCQIVNSNVVNFTLLPTKIEFARKMIKSNEGMFCMKSLVVLAIKLWFNRDFPSKIVWRGAEVKLTSHPAQIKQ